MVNQKARAESIKGREDVGALGIAHEWVKDRLKAIGKKQKELAVALDIPPSRLSERIRGKTEFETREIPVLARELKMPVNVVFARLTGKDNQIASEDTVLLEIRGEAKAGLWGKAAEWPPEKWEYTMVAKDAKYADVFGLRITGDDMEEYYPPSRSTVIYVPYAQFKSPVGHGDHVVVQRSDGNGQFEVTVKEVAIKDGQVWLEPHSGNKAYKSLELSKTDGSPDYYGTSTLKITGVVLKAVIDHAMPQTGKDRATLPESL